MAAHEIVGRTLSKCTTYGEWVAAATAVTHRAVDEVEGVLKSDCYASFDADRSRPVPPSCTVMYEVEARRRTCPPAPPSMNLATLNAGVADLDRKLVPIAATKVRECRWNAAGHLNDGGQMSLPSVSAFVALTNRLQHLAVPPQQRAHPRNSLIASQPTYLTFATSAQQVTLRFDAAGIVTNGVLTTQSTCVWEAVFVAVDCIQSPAA